MEILSDVTTKASVEIKNENGDDYALLKSTGTGRTIWVQATDPGGSAADGDIWIQIP